MPITPSRSGSERALVGENRRFYDGLWSAARLVEPQRFNTWPLVQSLLPCGARRLEIAPGLRPRLPIEGTQFLDISVAALSKLSRRGAQVTLGEVSSLPFQTGAFDLVCALDIIEHVEDGDGALAELSRVAAPGATLLLSTPLHQSMWTPFDDFVGHKRRYEPEELAAKLTQYHLGLERSAVYGMAPRSSRLLDLGMWWLTHHRERAMWWYNHAFMPLGLHPGMIATAGVDEVLLVCRRKAP